MGYYQSFVQLLMYNFCSVLNPYIYYKIFYNIIILYRFFEKRANFLASIPITYEITATDKEIITIVAKFLKKGSSFATDI